ncbi:MAG: efflux RND transporter permease subunit [Desulfotalea sp.]
MHVLSAWFTRNPVAANLVMMLALVAGYFSLTEIRIEGFPALPPSSVTVYTSYPGATPEQVDLNVSQRIVKSLEGVAGIKKSSSISSQSSSEVTVEKVSGYDLDRFQNEIQSRIDAISGLPGMVERSTVVRDEFKVEALTVQVYGDTDQMTLQKTARMVREKLLSDPTIAKLSTFGFRPYQIRIELDETQLQHFGLTLKEVSAIIWKNSLDYSTGELKSEGGAITIKADHKAFFYDDFVQMPITTLVNGTRITLKDVARVVDGFDESDFIARYNGVSAVGLQAYTTQKGDLLEVSEAAHKIVNSLHQQLPSGVQVEIWGEYSTYMKDRLHLLKTNAWQGLLIVFLLLALFLDLRLAFWVALGIPISMGAVFIVMGERLLDYSLNDITTFGLIVVMGILVDDAVIFGESVFETRRLTKDPIEGTIAGVRKVSTATTFGCMTTIAAFYPLLLIQNDLGQIFASFSMVVIIALIASLFESKFILPAHLAAIDLDAAPKKNILSRSWTFCQTLATKCLYFVNIRLYTPLLGRLLEHRYSALIVFITVGTIGVGCICQQKIRTVFFPEIPGQMITINLKMHSGSPLHLLIKNIGIVEDCGKQLNVKMKVSFATDLPPIARIMTVVEGENNATLWAELQPEKQREVGTMDILNRWRDKVGTLEGVEEISFNGSFETGGGFGVELTGSDDQTIAQAVEILKSRLATVKGVYDIKDDLSSPAPRIRLQLKEEAQHLGFTARDLASSIGDAFGGLEVQRVQRGSEEVKVIVRYQNEKRKYIQDLLQTRIVAPNGKRIPLTAIAKVFYDNQPVSVYRKNGLKTIEVTAKLDKKELSPTEAYDLIQEQIAPDIIEKYPDIHFGGDDEITEMKGGLKKALIVIFMLIYVLLAIPLKSYWQPIIIMSVIPFGFVGAAIGHGLMGHTLSVLSFFGMLAAMGIVINDSLVMLTRYNQLREENMPTNEALIKAGSSRFRPIFLTTVTTVCGLLPLLTETSEQAQYLIPAAISLAFGELFATPITLCLIPLLVKISEDFTRFFGFMQKTNNGADKHKPVPIFYEN